jgi:cytochrome c553
MTSACHTLFQTSLVLALFVGTFPTALGQDQPGQKVFVQKCARCHGANGEGVKDEYAHPLIGNRTVPQLAKYIARTMPDDAPGTCVGEEADQVAKYIYDAFYSKEARERNKPPRVELSRLTVRQYRHSIADLIASFRGQGHWDDKRGLKAEYFKGRRMNQQARALERTDAEVKFDFAEKSPVEGKIEPHEFSIRWSGSLLAPDTGEYEFIVKTEHAARLWVNNHDFNKPLIDAWVKSGKDTEFKGTLYLVGGRVYPLKLEFSKAKQGVDDSKDQKSPPKPVKASIALEWKPPKRVTEVVPNRVLSPNWFPETLCVATPFPPDDRSYGWERGTAISKAWDAATTDAALDVATYVATHLNALAGTRDNAADREKKVREFCSRFAERAFRRPLTSNEKARYVDRAFEASKDLPLAAKRVVLAVLKSPRFLYREPSESTDGYDVACRLSFALWDSLPDTPLLQAAAKGQLKTPDQVRQQAERMLADVRARGKVREFFHYWLKIDQVNDLAKDPKRFTGFDAAVIADLRTSLDLFLDDVVWGKEASFADLMLADELYLNGRLAKFYGLAVTGDGYQKAKLNADHRAGVLTHPFIMASFAYTGESSPIHRGVFLARGLLGLPLRPPPEAVAPLPPDLHPSLNTRERVALQTKSQACMGCHGMINPLGFSLEHFDAVGRYREKDNGKPIDASGVYQTRSGETVSFKGVRELARYLAKNDDVHAAFVEQVFHHLVKQPVRAFGNDQLAKLKQRFAEKKYNIRHLLVEIAAATALPVQPTEQAGVSNKKN